MVKGTKHSPETRVKMSRAREGRKLTEEHRKNIGLAHLGMKRPQEFVDKISGENNPMWNGGRSKTSAGYVRIWNPSHPGADCRGYVYEHRLIMEKNIGRLLEQSEVVHHENNVVDDNKIDNLVLFSSTNEHTEYHWRRDGKHLFQMR